MKKQLNATRFFIDKLANLLIFDYKQVIKIMINENSIFNTCS